MLLRLLVSQPSANREREPRLWTNQMAAAEVRERERGSEIAVPSWHEPTSHGYPPPELSKPVSISSICHQYENIDVDTSQICIDYKISLVLYQSQHCSNGITGLQSDIGLFLRIFI